jgi:hypothetical protein
MFTCDAPIAFVTTNFNFTGFLSDLRCGLNRNVNSQEHLNYKPVGACNESYYNDDDDDDDDDYYYYYYY